MCRACFCTAISFTALTLLAEAASAAVTEVWTHRYNNPNAPADEAAFAAARDAAGNVIVAGVSDLGVTGQDILVIKYSGTNGAVLWQKYYDGPANNDDSANAVAVDSSGNVIVTGQSGNSNGDADFCTLKYSGADGTLIWEQHYDGPAHDDDIAYAVAVDGSGDVLVTGTSFGDYYTAKYRASDGALLWEKRYNGLGNFNDVATAVAADSNRDVIVTGYSSRGGYNYDCYTAKYATADGALLWEQRYNGPADSYDYAVALAVDGSNNVVIAGFSSDGSNYDYYTAKYAATNGALLWDRRYDGGNGGDDFANAMAVDYQGNVIVTGESGNLGGYSDFYTAKYAASDGAILWEKRFNGPASKWDIAYAVALDTNGNVAITGKCLAADPNYYYDYCTVRYAAADGALLWQHLYDGPASDEDIAYAVVVDNGGNVMVTGMSRNNYDESDIYTAKYAATNGAVLWEQRFNGSANTDDNARSVAVDAAGNVVVTGTSYGRGGYSRSDFYTAKYSRTDGALLWENYYNGPSDGLDQGIAVAVDSHGDVIVAGTSEGDYYIVKYAGTDGAVLWEQRFDGQERGRVTALVLDDAGNAAVTGDFPLAPPHCCYGYCTIKCAATNGAVLWSQIRGAFDDEYGFVLPTLAVDTSGNVVMSSTVSPAYYTVKFAAATGAVLWETNYGSLYSANKAGAVAVDLAGNVIVTGAASRTNGSGYEYATLKYAAADGAVLWEKRYGELPGGLTPQALTVDTNGNVIVSGYFTAKFAALNGALLWSNSPPATNDAYTQSAAVDFGGNVIVAGQSKGSGGSYDYYTAKYAATNGALLWQASYNGPANGDERGGGLALGPNGMIAITGSSDGNFGSGTAYDYATVVYHESLPALSIASLPTGIRLRFVGVPGQTYHIERANNVTGPWSSMATIVMPPGGLLEYTNSPAGTSFYRMASPP